METFFFDDPQTRRMVARQRRFERWTRIAVTIALVLFFTYHCSTARLAEKAISAELVGLFVLFAAILIIVHTVVQWLLGQFFFAPTRYSTYGACARRMQHWAKRTIPGLRSKVWKRPWPQLLGMETVGWTLILDCPATGFRGMNFAGHQILDVRLTNTDPETAERHTRLAARLKRRLLPAYSSAPKRRWWLEITFTLPGARDPARAVFPFGKFGRDAENWRRCILSLKN